MYKMDFDEERESREKLATEKEKIADELRATQQENKQLNAELETLKKQPTQSGSAFGNTSRSVMALHYGILTDVTISARQALDHSLTTTTPLPLQGEAGVSGQALDLREQIKTIHPRFDSSLFYFMLSNYYNLSGNFYTLIITSGISVGIFQLD